MLNLEPEWVVKTSEVKPNITNVKLSKFSDRLPSFKAYEHQVKTVELFSSGKDVLLTAGLASGKTEAALAALEESGCFPAVFVYPTRALARDQHERFVEYGFDSTIADSDHSYWREKLAKRGCEILVTNPEMIWRHYRKSYALRRYLTSGMFRAMVFDEVHFYHPSELNKLLAIVRTFRRLRFMFLSATVGNPREFCREVSKITGRECLWVSGKAFSSGKTFIAYPGKYSETIINTANWVIEEGRKAIFFYQSRSSAEKWYLRLSRSFGEDKVVLHHGALPRKDRREAEMAFKLGRANIMITVKTLQQGIDVGDCDTILHTHLPPRVSDFHQREGRSGRREGVDAVSVLTSHEEDHWSTRILKSERLFRRLYLEADPEHLLASSYSPLSRRIDRHDHPGFYSGHTVKLVDEKGREISTYGVDDVPYRLVPGALLLRSGKIYMITDIRLKDREAVATPAPANLASQVKSGLWFRVNVETVTNARVGEMKPAKLTVIAKEVVYEMDGQVIDTIPANVSVTLDALAATIRNPSSVDESEAAMHLIHQCLREHGIPLDAFKHVVQPDRIIVFEHPPAVLARVLTTVDPEELEEYDAESILTIHPICPWHGDPSDNTPRLAADILQELQELAVEFDEVEMTKSSAKSELKRLSEVSSGVGDSGSNKRSSSSEQVVDKPLVVEKVSGSDATYDSTPRCYCGGELRQVFHAGKLYWHCDKCGRTFDKIPRRRQTTSVSEKISEARRKIRSLLDKF